MSDMNALLALLVSSAKQSNSQAQQQHIPPYVVQQQQPAPYILQQPQPTPFVVQPPFDHNHFSSHHMQQTSTVKRLMEEQEKVEGDMLSLHDRLKEQLLLLQNQIDAQDIIGGDVRALKLKLSSLSIEKRDYERVIQERMESLVLEQQLELASLGFPLFKASQEKDDLVKQHWILAPYLA